MAKKTDPKPLTAEDLDGIEGGGLLDAEPGTFGFEAITLERSAKAPYIGETEKNVWKAPAGLTHDSVFED